MSMTKIKTILCVEDDKDSCELITFLLEAEGYIVETCNDGAKALEMSRLNLYSAIILDGWLGDADGVDICREIRTYNSSVPIIFYSGAAYPKDKKAGLDAGAQAYLIKPNDLEKIPKTVEKFIAAENVKINKIAGGI